MTDNQEYTDDDYAFYQEAPQSLAEFDARIGDLQRRRDKFQSEDHYQDFLREMNFRWFEDTYLNDALQRDRHGKNPDSRVIYLLLNPDNGHYKIGFSANLPHRLKNIRGGCPGARVVGTLPGGSQAEHQFHMFFQDKRVAGEWFNLDPFDVKMIARHFTQIFPA